MSCYNSGDIAGSSATACFLLLRLKHQCLHLWRQPDSLALPCCLAVLVLAGIAAYRCAASHLASSVTNNLLAFGARLATASKTEYTTTTDPSGYSYDNKVHGPVQCPRYIHRGSGRRFVYSGSAIPSLWTARRASASQLRHQSDAAHTTNIHLCFLKKHTLRSQQLKPVKLASLNIQSLTNKSLVLNEFVGDNNIYFLCLSETWHNNCDYLSLNEATLPGYKYFEKARNSGHGGGLALIYRETFGMAEIQVPDLP